MNSKTPDPTPTAERTKLSDEELQAIRLCDKHTDDGVYRQLMSPKDRRALLSDRDALAA